MTAVAAAAGTFDPALTTGLPEPARRWLGHAIPLIPTAFRHAAWSRSEAESRFGGIPIPSVFRAGWWWGTGRQHEGEFVRADITGAVFS